MDVRKLGGDEVTSTRLLAELPKARFAHLATHGFFADAATRSAHNLDTTLFEITGQERVAAGSLSPFVLSGLVCSNANRTANLAEGVVTAEAILGADLSRLDLAVLSACETGLGDVGGGEGVFGLQRGFHCAGCRNVVASLWQVNDEATAALMSRFYARLWEEKLPAIEALRQAQLDVYRHPAKINDWATRGGLKLAPFVPAANAMAPERSPVRHWAAFVLSGNGR